MLFNFCRLSLACVVIYFSSLASSRATVIVHTIESTGGFTFDRFSPVTAFNIPINLTISMDNGGTSIESQTWGLNDVISFEISVPSQSFTFYRDTSDFLYAWRTNSTINFNDSFSRFEIMTDSSGIIVSRDIFLNYNLIATPSDNRTPRFPDDDFISYTPEGYIDFGSGSYSSFTGGGSINASTGASITETLTVTAVPEPSSMLLLSLGSLLACVSRRRR